MKLQIWQAVAASVEQEGDVVIDEARKSDVWSLPVHV